MGLVLPEPFDRFVVNAIVHLVPNNPGQFAIPKSVVEGFEARQFLHDGFGDRLAPAWPDDLRVLGKQSQSALLPKAAGEVAHRFGMGVRFLGSLRRGAIFHEDHWANQLIAPLDMIDKAELELVKIGMASIGVALPANQQW